MAQPRRRPAQPTRNRVNRQIRKSPVRLIDEEGQQLGVLPVREALDTAKERGLDLVEVGPQADPPVVKIMDWGRVKFERDKKARETRRKTQTVEVKEVKFRPTIDEHDYERKLKRARAFLRRGKKVKCTVFFRLRQLRRPDLGAQILEEVSAATSDVGEIETRGGLDGRRMTLVLAPRN